MAIALVILHVFTCFMLIAVILLQAGRGQGFTGSSFGGGGVQSIFGTRTADFLTKATSVSAVLFLFTCIGLDIVEVQRSRSLFETQGPVAPIDVQQIQRVLEKIKEEKQEEGSPAPSAPTQPAEAPAPSDKEGGKGQGG